MIFFKNFSFFKKKEPIAVYGVPTNRFFEEDNSRLISGNHYDSYAKNENIKVYGTPTDKFFTKETDFFDLLKDKNPKLKNLFIEVTLNCNEHCKHCGSNCGDNKLENQLSDEEIINCLTELKEDMKNQELPFITITGGEPLLRKSLPQLMTNINKMGYNWGMTSNATLITKDVAFQLKEAGLYSISVSIDGTEESHNWFRKTSNGYTLAIYGIQNLIEVGIPHVMVTTVVHKRNINELDKIKKVVESLNCEMWRIINVDPIGRARNNHEILLDTKDYKYILDYIVKNNSEKLPIIYSCNYYLGPQYENTVRPWDFKCDAGLKVAGIQYNGDVGACLDIERTELTKQGNIRNRRLYDIWLNEFKIFRKSKIENSEKCKNCKFSSECDGGGFHTWDFEKNEPRFCIMDNVFKGGINNGM